MIRLAALFAAIALSACAARMPPRPSGTPGPDPTAADAFITATASCRGFRSIEGELALSGRAGEERVRGRVLTGLEAGGAVRLEAPAPFGAPFFILAGRNEIATLVLPRERRVLADTPVSAVLERLTGLSLGADDLRLVLSGCLVEQPAPADGRQWPGGWQAVTIGPERVAYLRTAQGRPVLVAADYGPWHVDYSQHASGFPRVVRVRSAVASAKADATAADRSRAIDITARVEQLEVNTEINPLAWKVEVPSDADPMTLDELRSIAPLAERTRPN
jgi:outer membrane biogenesis lipoprotein LolB